MAFELTAQANFSVAALSISVVVPNSASADATVYLYIGGAWVRGEDTCAGTPFYAAPVRLGQQVTVAIW